jgi:hypothetical protein
MRFMDISLFGGSIPAMRLWILALLVLAACASKPPTVQQLLAMDDATLCQSVQEWPLRYEVTATMSARGLACHPAQQQCVALGLTSEAYVDCLSAIVQQMRDEEARRAEARMLYGAAILSKQQTCTTTGSTVICY